MRLSEQLAGFHRKLRSAYRAAPYQRYNFPVDSTQQLGRMLLLTGSILMVLGALFYFGAKLPFRLGRLPGDIVHHGQHGTFYFPLVSCIVVSIVVSLILWLINNFRR